VRAQAKSQARWLKAESSCQIRYFALWLPF
jgi:hypothetical protein